jgi:hypothetical protein
MFVGVVNWIWEYVHTKGVMLQYVTKASGFWYTNCFPCYCYFSMLCLVWVGVGAAPQIIVGKCVLLFVHD